MWMAPVALVMATTVAPAASAQDPAAPRIERLDPAIDALIAPDAAVERIATGFSFTEGPVWQGDRLWFSDVTGDVLRTVDRNGRVTEVLANAGGLPNPPPGANIGSNGLAPARDGGIAMVQMGARRIVHRDAQGRLTPVVSEVDGKRLNSPNDLVYAPDGALWFTDPPFGLFNGMDKDPAKQLAYNGVFRFAGGVARPVITDLKLPNGIGLTADGRTLYVGDYGQATIFAYTLGKDGAVSGKRTLFAFPRGAGAGGVDGLKVDRRGNVWATGPGGIWIITAAGKLIGRIHMPEVAANLAFGEGGNAAWITASKSVYRVPIKGVGLMPRFAR